MGVVTELKSAVAQILGDVPGIGTIDPAQLDAATIPPEFAATPYWGLSLGGIAVMPPSPAGLGGTFSRSQFLAYWRTGS